MNNLMQSGNGDENGMLGTKNKLIESVCENTTKTSWTKLCPQCNKIQEYSNKYKLERAKLNNSKCFECGQSHRKILPESIGEQLLSIMVDSSRAWLPEILVDELKMQYTTNTTVENVRAELDKLCVSGQIIRNGTRYNKTGE